MYGGFSVGRFGGLKVEGLEDDYRALTESERWRHQGT